eukprot:1044647-Amorphochlora_amoeboformis.AAC.1
MKYRNTVKDKLEIAGDPHGCWRSSHPVLPSKPVTIRYYPVVTRLQTTRNVTTCHAPESIS